MMVRPRGELRRQQFDIGGPSEGSSDHPREAVTVLDHRVAAILETTDLVEVPAKVVVLETALGLVQSEVLEDSCCWDLTGGVSPNVPGAVGTIPGPASRALLEDIIMDSLDLFKRVAAIPSA